MANLYMENFEVIAINTSLHPPLMWKRFVDDTLVVIKAAHKQEFLDHINSIDHHIINLQVKTPDQMDPCLSWI